MSAAPALLAGEAACLAAAFLWALAVILFRRPIESYGARTVNLAKCLLAAALLGATTLAAGQGAALAAAPDSALAALVASGLVGLVVGDTALFAAVPRIGVHRTFLLQTLSPVFAAILAYLWQGERPTMLQSAGAVLILAGVSLVVAPRRPLGGPGAPTFPPHRDGAPVGATLAAGILLGVVAAAGQGFGIVLAKSGLEHVPFVPATFLRLAVAALGLGLLGAAQGRLGRLAALVRSGRALLYTVPATLLGTYLAMTLMMVGVSLAPASVAAVLLATSPVFSLFLEALVEKRSITLISLGGTLLAVLGVAVLTSG